jgi:hypothetical protein
MQTSYEILTQIQTDAAADLPDLFYASALDDMDVYEIGQSRDDSHKGFFIYQDKVSHDDTMNRVDLIYQLQLPGVSALDAAKYADEVYAWIRDYDFQRIGMTILDNIVVETWPNAKDRTTFIFFDVSVLENLDSCD